MIHRERNKGIKKGEVKTGRETDTQKVRHLKAKQNQNKTREQGRKGLEISILFMVVILRSFFFSCFLNTVVTFSFTICIYRFFKLSLLNRR